MGVHFHLLGYINSFWRRREWGSRELARIKRYQSWAFLFGDKVTNSEKKIMEVRAAKPVISSMLNQRRLLAQRRRMLATTTQRGK